MGQDSSHTPAVSRRTALLACALGLVGAGCRSALGSPDILFVATPDDVGLQMLRLARIGAGDVVYDLGSGDGRLVITAAREFGARGVGVEIDPGLVQDSREAALKAGVADTVAFVWANLFEVDISTATVVTLYLRDDVNLRLRPKLLRELRPGTRVVSHDFGMADWQPDQVVRVRSRDRGHTVYLWIVPVTIDGAWDGSVSVGDVGRTAALALRQRFQHFEGTLSLDGRGTPVEDGTIAGDRLAFAARAEGRVLRFRGRVADGALAGDVEADGTSGGRWRFGRAAR
jgi:SAM-dependent methyltransferase